VPSTALRKQLMQKVRSIVVKIGTAVLTREDGRLHRALIGQLARQVAALRQRGITVTLVSSGAVGAGIKRAGLPGRPRALPMVQATAAIGQPALMAIYERAFAKFGLHIGQVLVTRADFEQRTRYLNISNTMAALHKLNAIPIINENDTTAVDELDRFADNDIIASLLTNLLQADLLIILTVVDGLLDSQGRLVDLVTRVDEEIRAMAKSRRSALGSGGMASKINAARLVADAGGGTIISHGRRRDVLLRLLDGERVGTIFAPATRRLSARQRWIFGAVRPAGNIAIDAGAALAVRTQGKSLLARGIIGVLGQFDRGDIVRVVGPGGLTIAHGVSNYSSQELEAIKGLKSSDIAGRLGHKPFDEAVHRDNLVLTAGEE